MDEPLAGELAGGEARRFTAHLAAGDYVRVVVEQFGLDVAVSLDDPEGTERLRVDSPNGSVGPERLDFVAEITGRHQLQITAAEGVGRYEVRLEARRPATAQDREAGKAAKKFFEAEKFHLARHFEAAIDAYGEAIESWQLLGEGAQEAYTHFKVGLINQRQHRWASAIEAYSKVVELFRQLGGTDRLAPYVLNRLGTAYRETLALEDASKAHEEALRLAREFGEGREQASALNNLALIDRQQGRTRR
ncbi:MAG: tetratricopeptide repeat protein, partial [Acidobacteriota bacterium]